MNAPKITEDWLRECGFKWDQVDRQPTKHWLLWLGDAVVSDEGFRVGHDSLGIELAADTRGTFHCWIRNDIAGRYARIIHIRHLYLQAELVALIESLVGRKFEWWHAMYGSLRAPYDAERMRKEDRERIDRRIDLAWVDRVDHELGVHGIDKDKRGVKLP